MSGRRRRPRPSDFICTQSLHQQPGGVKTGWQLLSQNHALVPLAFTVILVSWRKQETGESADGSVKFCPRSRRIACTCRRDWVCRWLWAAVLHVLSPPSEIWAVSLARKSAARVINRASDKSFSIEADLSTCWKVALSAKAHRGSNATWLTVNARTEVMMVRWRAKVGGSVQCEL